MADTYNIYDAKMRLSELVDRASRGEEIVIAKYGTPVARLVPLPREKPKRVPGLLKGKIWVSDDFDVPLPWETQRYFEGYEDGDEVEPPRPPGYEEPTPAPDPDGGQHDGGQADGA